MKEVSEMVQMKEDTICNIENGRNATHITTLKLIADALRVDIKLFM